MKLEKPTALNVIWNDESAPDVWWGPDGIDALIWADPRPYEAPADIIAAPLERVAL